MKILYTILITCGLLVAYLAIGVFQLASMNEEINGKTGVIWTQLQSGFEKLAAVETQLKAAYKDRKDIIESIVEGRKEYIKATENQNITQAMHAADLVRNNLKVVVENYPSTDISSMQTGVLDETAGIFNRIAYARQQLIDTQVQFNKARLFFFPIASFFTRKEILGQNTDPMAQGPKSSF